MYGTNMFSLSYCLFDVSLNNQCLLYVCVFSFGLTDLYTQVLNGYGM